MYIHLVAMYERLLTVVYDTTYERVSRLVATNYALSL
jgi:hypothetical protein